MSNIKLYIINYTVPQYNKIGIASVAAISASKAQSILQATGKYNAYKYSMSYPVLVHTTDTFTAESIITELDNPAGEKGDRGPAGKDAVCEIPITYSELVRLRNESKLSPGTFYRITDYECITTQAGTRSANHPFDIIVQALDKSTLSENAQAIARDGDTYFANAKLEAWQLKYTIDNDAARFSWAKAEVLEQPQKWECEFGVLESSFDDSPSNNYTTADIDGKTWYLYKPLEPTSHLLGYSFYRKEYVGESITDVNNLVFVSDEAPTYYEDEYESYLSWPYEIRVMTKDGKLVTTLYNDFDNVYYDENDYDYMCRMDFDPNAEYDEELGAYRYSTPDGALGWWYDFMGGVFGVVNYIPYTGDTRNLSYAFESPLGNGYTTVYKAYDGTYIYTTENEDEDGEQAIDTVQYTAYVPYEEEGKGVIYEMVDEHNNHCPYDFKNMQFLNNNEWYYTFSFKGNDLSLTDYCVDNYIYTNRSANFDDTTTHVPNSIPMMVFNAKANASGKTIGFAHNVFEVSIAKGYISATRIEDFVWKPKLGGNIAVVDTLYINVTGVCYGNTIYGSASTFTVGSSSASVAGFYDNEIHLATYQKNAFKCNATTFANNKLDLTESSAGFTITAGSMTSCNITNTYYETARPSDKIEFGANVILRDCTIRMYQALTINYANTTSTTSPLRFLNIDARGWSASTISIPSTFPARASYELKVAKNSKGEIKMWCDADLIQEIQ